ncbi:cell wall hydrolase [Rubrimonas cliftonensis]|uniref:Cell Wall Hydrolase n=1 Tax=Rubrimonas cliftonensis TaxID=89524 RepID=A0A1H3X7Z2_9RHOB|nr:cell wall hydrolase [Rubrimonas cliftonensis]SDZ94772.1 Cell Wall Hydrolase [Rubrimonas cliftonensis]
MIALAKAAAMAVAMAGQQAGLPDSAAEALGCLALNVYHEARSEGAIGRRAVAHVTLNRMRDPRFPDDVCGVVTQSAGGSCQFSWWCDGRSDAPRNMQAFELSARAAARVMAGQIADPTDGALYFLPKRMGRPGWTRDLRQTAVIGEHRFFE